MSLPEFQEKMCQLRSDERLTLVGWAIFGG